jgi:hypothetical protein
LGLLDGVDVRARDHIGEFRCRVLGLLLDVLLCVGEVLAARLQADLVRLAAGLEKVGRDREYSGALT